MNTNNRVLLPLVLLVLSLFLSLSLCVCALYFGKFQSVHRVVPSLDVECVLYKLSMVWYGACKTCHTNKLRLVTCLDCFCLFRTIKCQHLILLICAHISRISTDQKAFDHSHTIPANCVCVHVFLTIFHFSIFKMIISFFHIKIQTHCFYRCLVLNGNSDRNNNHKTNNKTNNKRTNQTIYIQIQINECLIVLKTIKQKKKCWDIRFKCILMLN